VEEKRKKKRPKGGETWGFIKKKSGDYQKERQVKGERFLIPRGEELRGGLKKKSRGNKKLASF